MIREGSPGQTGSATHRRDTSFPASPSRWPLPYWEPANQPAIAHVAATPIPSSWPLQGSGWPGQAGTPDPPAPPNVTRHPSGDHHPTIGPGGRWIGARSGLDADSPTFDHWRRRDRGAPPIATARWALRHYHRRATMSRAPAARRASEAERERAQAGRSRRRVSGRQARLEDVQEVLTNCNKGETWEVEALSR